MNLDLLEEFLLIALDDDKGGFVIGSTALHYGFGGAVLLELALRDKIEIDGEKVILKDSAMETELALNKSIELIKGSKARKVKEWIEILAKKSDDFKDDTLQRLINKCILSKEEHKILWIIPKQKYPTSNMNPEMKVRKRLEDVVQGGKKAKPRDVMLLSLIDATDLTKEAFRKAEDYKKIKARLAEVTQDVKISAAINKSLREIQTAIMLAIATKIVVTTVATN